MAKGKNIAYVRVSTTDQNEARVLTLKWSFSCLTTNNCA